MAKSTITRRPSNGYNGHKNWTHWNVSLWLTNEEPLYRLAGDMLAKHGAKRGAYRLQAVLGGPDARTPDGARYSIAAISATLKDL